MNVSEMFPGRWITAQTLQGREFDLTIREVTTEVIGDETRWVVWFDECEAGLPLNKTNGLAIAQLHGEESNLWAGKRIRLFTDQATWQGKPVAAVRVRLEVPPPAPAAEPEPTPEPDLGDVPF